MTREAMEAELQKRRDQLKTREGKVGFKANAEALKARIAELVAELEADNG